MKAAAHEGRIYVMHDTDRDLLKVGWTRRSPEVRRRELEQSIGTTIVLLTTVPGTMAQEKIMHWNFAAHRVYGEWFHNVPAVRDFFL